MKNATSEAMAAGMTDRLWDIGDIVKLVEASEAKSGSRAIRSVLLMNENGSSWAGGYQFDCGFDARHVLDVHRLLQLGPGTRLSCILFRRVMGDGVCLADRGTCRSLLVCCELGGAISGVVPPFAWWDII